MTEAEYFEKRLDDQIKWYGNKSQKCQRFYKWLKSFSYILALALPPLGYYADCTPCSKFSIAMIGLVIAALEFFSSLNKYHENWIQYRTTCELLKHEKYLYCTRAGGYTTAADPFKELVERCESIISSENIDWAQLHKGDLQMPVHS